MRLTTCFSLAVLSLIFATAPASAATPEQQINAAFPYIAGEGGAPHLPMGELTAPDTPGMRYFKVQERDGDVAHLYAHGPFAFAEGGQVASFDTDLVAEAAGWRAASVPFDVMVPTDLSDGIVWQDAGRGESVRIYPQNINRSAGRMYAGTTDTVIYDDVWNHAFMTLAVTPHGVKDHIILTQANGVPNQFKFRVERPAGASTAVAADGSVQVVGGDGVVLAKLPAPAARDRDHQEFKIWYEVENHSGFDVIVLRYDTSPVTAEGKTVSYEAPFDLDPAIYSGALAHGENAFRETSLNEYTVSDFNGGNLRASLLKVASYEAGKFARWYITPPKEGSRWYSFSARAEGLVGVTQKYSLTDNAGVRYEFGPAAEPGTYFAQDVSFTPQGDINSRIEATATSTPLYDYYGQLTNPVLVYEDLVDPILTDLRPNGSTVSSNEVTLRLGMQDGQSGCGSITVTLHGPVAPIGTKTGNGCTFAPTFNLRTEGTHRIDVTLADRSDRKTIVSGSFTFDSPIDPPQPPVIDGLSPDADEAWTDHRDAFSATWNTASGAAGYQVCFATSPCSPDERWVGAHGTSATVGGYAFGQGELVLACVRSITAEGIRTTAICSNGVRVDFVPPNAPTTVRDGLAVGEDAATTFETYSTSGNWDPASDEFGIAEYQTCVVLQGASCPTKWLVFEDSPLQLSATHDRAMGLGTTVVFCVRAVDHAGNISPGACSNGQRVTPSTFEVDQLAEARNHFGLDTTIAQARELLTNPPDEGTAETFGFVTTKAEDSRLRAEVALAEDSSVLSDIYGEKYPDAYAGTVVRKDRTVLVMFTRNVSAHERRLLQWMTKTLCADRKTKPIRRCKPRVKIKLVKYSLKELRALQDRVSADAAILRSKHQMNVSRVAIDVGRNRTKVVVSPTTKRNLNKQKAALHSRYGGRPISIESEEPAGLAHNRNGYRWPAYTRWTYGWYFGMVPSGTAIYSVALTANGGQIEGPTPRCSAGFSVTYDGNPYLMTARHCLPPAALGVTSVFSNSSRDRFSRRLGGGPGIIRGIQHDVALVPLRDGNTWHPERRSGYVFMRTNWLAPDSDHIDPDFPTHSTIHMRRIYHTAHRPSKVKDRAKGITGNLICKSGVTTEGLVGRSGYRCGQLLEVGAEQTYYAWEEDDGRERKRLVDIASLPTCGGDSGSGVFWFGDADRPEIMKLYPVGITSKRGGKLLTEGKYGQHSCSSKLIYAPILPVFREFKAGTAHTMTGYFYQ